MSEEILDSSANVFIDLGSSPDEAAVLQMRADLSRRRSNIHLYPDDWKQLPVPIPDQKIQKSIASKVDAILAALERGRDISDLEKDIDEMVTALYLSSSEDADGITVS